MMSTYNGEKYLSEQLDSILCQEGVEFQIYIRDDGSTDGTIEIIRKYQLMNPDTIIYQNLDESMNIGFAKSFFTLLQYVLESRANEYDYYAFADQDDVWLVKKLIRACLMLKQYKDSPALYFGKKKIVDEKLTPISHDFCNYHRCFEDIFERSNASGCTMVFNKQYARLFDKKGMEKTDFIHDAYLYRLALCADFPIIYDNKPYILYRQHKKNTVGAINRECFVKKIMKIWKIFDARAHYIQGIIQNIYTEFNDYINEMNKTKMENILTYNLSVRSKIRFLQFYIKDNRSTVNEEIMIIMRIIFNFI